MSKRFLNNSVHQKTTGMQISVPTKKTTGNQGTVAAQGEVNQSEPRESAVRNQADQIYRNLKQQISRHQQESVTKDNNHNRDNCKYLSISTSENCQNSKGQVMNIFEDTMTKLSHSRAADNQPSSDGFNNK